MRVEPISGVSSIIPVIPVLPVRKIKKIEKTRRPSGVAFVSDLRQTIEEQIRTEYEQKYQALLNNSPQAQSGRLEKQMELMRAQYKLLDKLLASQTRTFQEQYSRVQILRKCREYYGM